MEKGHQVGFLILKEDGAVLESGGEMENDEKSAVIIMELVKMTESIDENFIPKNSCDSICINYEDHWYNICMSNRRIFVTKLREEGSSNGSSVHVNTDTSSTTILA
ncbi:ragulator complex protein LAMTOR4 homolog [Teleopsis dalmanni]|uniref:ragulator complex protein LAMTOR4 homolog n=1 Tax=Teleopsis dalmanni TaxID=139649 RepID=UPI000D32C9DB|nr:ragulator complex protein LAMTOR4 homolog [Teleopsis dalmanni]